MTYVSKGKVREVGIQTRTRIAVSKDKCAKKKRFSSVSLSWKDLDFAYPRASFAFETTQPPKFEWALEVSDNSKDDIKNLLAKIPWVGDFGNIRQQEKSTDCNGKRDHTVDYEKPNE